MIRYFYIFPFKHQYYFPKEIIDYPFLKSLFRPYSFSAKVFWWIWNYVPFFKYLFVVSESRIPMDITSIRKNLDSDTIFAINTGTPGLTQKITAVGLNQKNRKRIFIKFSNRKVTKELTMHESNVLQNIMVYGFSPKVVYSYFSSDYSILVTEYINGKKLENIKLNDKLLELIITISKFDSKIQFHPANKDLSYSFAHGDFCPWNLLKLKDDVIMPIDWEFAQYHPLGFDLFTYIFQTSFLTAPRKGIKTIIDECEILIEEYFDNWNINNWYPYLKEFSDLKLNRGDVKMGSNLYNSLIRLRAYAEKA